MNIQQWIFQWRTNDVESYGINVGGCPLDATRPEVRKHLMELLNSSFEQKGLHVSSLQPIEHRGYVGYEAKVNSAAQNAAFRYRTLFVGTNAYGLLHFHPLQVPESPVATEFFESFRVVDPESN